MANNLNRLIPDLYAAMDKVSRELVGFIPAVGMNAGAGRAAVGEPIVVPVTGAANVVDIAPAMTTPEPTDQDVTNVQITITKSRAAEFGFVGEEQLGLNNGPGYLSIQAKMIAQAMRRLVNEVEADLASTYIETSRAYGASGSGLFQTNLGDVAQTRKLLADNGAPLSEMQMVIGTAGGAALRTLTNLTNVNQAGDDTLLRQGVLMPLEGFDIRESAQVKTHNKGTGANFQTTAAFSVGDTQITIDTGTGTVIAGDVVSFAGSDDKYVVATALTGNLLTIAAPGLRADVADNAAMTIENDYTASMAFDREAIQLVTRAPALPQEGDMALDRMTITDDRSGLTFEVSVYPGYRKVRYEIALAWGVKNIKPSHSVLVIS